MLLPSLPFTTCVCIHMCVVQLGSTSTPACKCTSTTHRKKGRKRIPFTLIEASKGNHCPTPGQSHVQMVHVYIIAQVCVLIREIYMYMYMYTCVSIVHVQSHRKMVELSFCYTHYICTYSPVHVPISFAVCLILLSAHRPQSRLCIHTMYI